MVQPLEFQMGEGMRRKDGITLPDFDCDKTIPLESIVSVMGYVRGPSGSEYHFSLGLDPRLQNVTVFCDDSIRRGSEEYLAVFKKISARLQSEIDPATGEGRLTKPQTKKEITDAIMGIFNDFGTPDNHRSVVVEYKTKQ